VRRGSTAKEGQPIDLPTGCDKARTILRRLAYSVSAKDVDKRIARLVAAIETGDDATSLIVRLRELEARRQAITVESANLQPVPRLEPALIEGRLAEWRRLLRQSTTQGRTVLQRILRGRLTFTPQIETGEMVGYKFEGPTRFDKLFAGIAGPAPKYVDRSGRAGTEHIGPEDTFEGDYGRLLDRFYKNNACEVPPHR
jgi:hypothetical protein